MCTKACFRDLLRSLCLQDLGLGWKKKLTVANVWFKLILQRPHEWSLIKINLHFLSIAREAGRAFQTRACVHPALLPLAAIRKGWLLRGQGERPVKCWGCLTSTSAPFPKNQEYPGTPPALLDSLNPEASLQRFLSMLGLTADFFVSFKMLRSPWNFDK